MDNSPQRYAFAIWTDNPQKNLASLRAVIDPIWPVTDAKVDGAIFVMIYIETAVPLTVSEHDKIKALISDAGSRLFSITIVPTSS